MELCVRTERVRFPWKPRPNQTVYNKQLDAEHTQDRALNFSITLAKEAMDDDFYRAFEERFRGTREEVKKKLEVYFPFLEPFTATEGKASALDLGCGRGEWLELLREWNIEAMGVDMDTFMLAACHAENLTVEAGDALAFLQSQENESHQLVSAIHVAEHLEFDQLLLVVQEALRVLAPGGLLILETPNPENIAVTTTQFYLDPTHRRPLPPALLAFVAEYCGFGRVNTFRLRLFPETATSGITGLIEGVSPDYTVIAQKTAAPDILSRFDVAFSRASGTTLRQLARRFDARIDHMENRIDQVSAGFLWRLISWIDKRLPRKAN